MKDGRPNNAIQHTFTPGTRLAVDRIYIRQRKAEFDSVTFKAAAGRFWVDLKQANEIRFVLKPEAPTKPFFLQNRYQDGRWENLEDERFDTLELAAIRAAALCQNAIVYGMVRIVHIHHLGSESVIATFPAGGFPQ